MNKYPHLFSPLKLGNLTLRNRIESAPTSPKCLTPEGYLTREDVAYFELKAAGGASIVTIREGLVHEKTGMGRFPCVNLENPEIMGSLAMTGRAIKRHGAISSIESAACRKRRVL